MNLKKLVVPVLISYVIILGINLTANYSYYAAGNDWRFSVFFTLSVTTIGWIGCVILFEFILKRLINWKKHPEWKLFLAIFISGIYGAVLMVSVMKGMVWILGFKDQPTGNYIDNSIYSVLFSMLISLMVIGQEFIKQSKKNLEDNERMKQEMLRSQYELLKSQVNPHFLFNALSTLATLIPENQVVAIDFVQQLSKVFRYSLQHADENTVSLETELKIVRSYLFLNKQRFEEKLIVNIDITPELLEKHIIAQSLLMLVENAIKHNEISNAKPLTIHIYDDGKDQLIIENSLQTKILPEHSTGIGLINIAERYKLASDKSVLIEKSNGLFTVKMPLLKDGYTDTGR